MVSQKGSPYPNNLYQQSSVNARDLEYFRISWTSARSISINMLYEGVQTSNLNLGTSTTTHSSLPVTSFSWIVRTARLLQLYSIRLRCLLSCHSSNVTNKVLCLRKTKMSIPTKSEQNEGGEQTPLLLDITRHELKTVSISPIHPQT